MSNKTPEGRIKEAICQWLSFHKMECNIFWISSTVGIWDAKRKIYRKQNSPFQLTGVSDIIGIWRARPLAIEIKAGSNKPSPEQVDFLTRFAKAGGIAICAWSIDDVSSILLNISNAARNPLPGCLSLEKLNRERK